MLKERLLGLGIGRIEADSNCGLRRLDQDAPWHKNETDPDAGPSRPNASPLVFFVIVLGHVNVLVAMRKDNAVLEMDILRFMQDYHVPGDDTSFPDAAAIAATSLSR